jgi:hypothetical protein
MSGSIVRQAVREALLGEPGGQGPPGCTPGFRDRRGTGGIASVLRKLHGPATEEPLPPDLAALLRALDGAERRGRP